MVMVNLSLLLLGVKYFGKKYAIKTIILISVFIDICNEFLNLQAATDNRPRKVLQYKTPNEIFFNNLQRKLPA